MSSADQKQAEALLAALGGKSVVANCQAVAGNRLRLELLAPVAGSEPELARLGVRHVLQVSDRITHLLFDDDTTAIAEAVTAQLGK